MKAKEIKIKDYHYELPEERIAKYPVKERDHSRLLICRHGVISEDIFCNLTRYLPQRPLMVFNNTKVIQARFHFRKATGAIIEIFLLEPVLPADYEQMFQQRGSCLWRCLVGNMKKWKGEKLSRTITVGGSAVRLTAEYIPVGTESAAIRLAWDNNSLTFADIIDAAGELPLPPYLKRKSSESDKTTYQTVYSKIKGSVAAPTAGLHFTERMLGDIDSRGIERAELTLHVGAGTFRPVKSDDIGHHEMHSEYFCVPRLLIKRLMAHNGEAAAVGTTSVRTLESLYYIGRRLIGDPDLREEDLRVSQWEPYQESPLSPTVEESLTAILSYLDRNGLPALHSSTQIIIVPGYRYKIVKTLITNFHQPESTLLLLVGAFLGEDWRSVYSYALTHDFRFLSYGDSSLLIP